MCEDTRQTQALLRSHGALREQRLVSADEHRWARHQPLLKKELIEGDKIVAFVSDAGTPGVSDPGAEIVQWLRSEGYENIVPIPGASALSTFISWAGPIGGSVLFVGFFPRKSGGRQKTWASAAQAGACCIGFESPRRVQRLLEDFSDLYGPQARVLIGRELTKTHEQFWDGAVSNALALLGSDKLPALGEWVIGFKVPELCRPGWQQVAQELRPLWDKKKLSLWIAEHFHVSRHDVYDFLIGKH